MANTKTYHAVIAKAKAMYGKRITEEQYSDMLRCRSVQEVASYLKSNTSYHDLLDNISDHNIHRGQLEILLKRAAFDNYARLYHYLPENRDSLFYFVLVGEEIREILRMVLLMKADNAKSFIVDLPGYLIQRSDVDLMRVAKAQSFDELVAALRGSGYDKILAQFTPTDASPNIDYVGCEHAFYNHFYKTLFHMIDNNYHGQEHTELSDLFRIQVELLNLEHVFRANFLKTPYEEVVRSLFPYYFKINSERMGQMVRAKDQNALRQLFADTKYRRHFEGREYSFVEGYTKRYFYDTCRKALRFSNYASVVFYAYFNLEEVEISNITTIIEGIRYQLPEKQIRELLIL